MTREAAIRIVKKLNKEQQLKLLDVLKEFSQMLEDEKQDVIEYVKELKRRRGQ